MNGNILFESQNTRERYELLFLPDAGTRNLLDTLSQLPVACILLGQDSAIEFINQAAEEIFGYSLEESRGRHPADLLVPANDRESLLRFLEGIPEAKTGPRVMGNRTKSGKTLVCKWHSKSLRDERGEWLGTLIAVQDVSNEQFAEEQLKRQVERLRALRTIDLAISGCADIQTILNVVLHEAMNRLMMSAAVLLIYDPVMNLLKFAAGRGLYTDALQFTALHPGEGYAGRAALEKTLIRVPSLNPDKTDFLRSPNFKREGFKSYYCVPLLSKGKIVGVLESFHRSYFVPDREWLDFFETLGGQAAIAIDNAKLFFDLQRSNLELVLAYDSTLEGWSRALDMRDRDTEGHTRRVTELTERLAVALNIGEAERVHIRRGAMLHDIGKLGVPDRILLKEGSLTDEEWAIIRQHPEMALKMLKPIAHLEPSLDIPYCHHEKWDGSGYPRGLKGDKIPLAARIFAVVDVFDALTSDRPYRRAWTVQQALEHIRAEKGRHFDPAIVDIFIGIVSNTIS
ncbi:MAG: HD domain-containing phosphohydrolase [Chloroflexota bacterium]